MNIMRLKFSKLSFLVVFINVVLVYYSWKVFLSFSNETKSSANVFQNKSIKHVSRLVTIIIRDVELNNNDVSSTVESIFHLYPNIQVFVVTNGIPYPPLRVFQTNNTSKNVRLLNLQNSFDVPHFQSYPLYYVTTPFVLFLPDSTRITNRHVVQQMVNVLLQEPDIMVAVAYGSKELECFNATINQREWKLVLGGKKNYCDFVDGKHGLLLDTNVLRKLNDAFLMPFPWSIYLQTSVMQYKVNIRYSLTPLNTESSKVKNGSLKF